MKAQCVTAVKAFHEFTDSLLVEQDAKETKEKDEVVAEQGAEETKEEEEAEQQAFFQVRFG